MIDNNDRILLGPVLRTAETRNPQRKAILSVAWYHVQRQSHEWHITGTNKETINYVHEWQRSGSRIERVISVAEIPIDARSLAFADMASQQTDLQLEFLIHQVRNM